MTLRKKLIIYLLTLVILPLLLLGGVNYSLIKEDLEIKTLSSLNTVADKKAFQLSAFAERNNAALKVLQNSIAVQSLLPLLVKYADETNHPDFMRAVSTFHPKLSKFQKTYQFSDIVLADRDGEVLYQSNKHHRSRWCAADLPNQEVCAIRPGISTSYTQNVDGIKDFSLMHGAAVLKSDGSTLGFVAFEIDLDSTIQLIQDSAGLGEHGFATLTKRDSPSSYVVVATSNKNIPQRVATNLSQLGSPMQQAFSVGDGSGLGETPGGEKVFAAWRYIPGLDMGLACALRYDAAFSTFNRSQIVSIVISAAVFFACMYIASEIFRAIVRPLKSLEKGALQIGRGDLSYQLPIEGNDEFAALAQRFNEMTCNLREVTASKAELDREIAERKTAEKKLDKERAFLQNIIDSVGDPVFVIACDYRVMLMNKAAVKSLPQKNATNSWFCYEASHHSDVPCDGADHPCPLLKVKETGKEFTVHHSHIGPDGTSIVCEIQASPFYDENGLLLGIIESNRDITDRLEVQQELNEKHEQIYHLAHHDSLTNLPNRVLFGDRLHQALEKSSRYGVRGAILMLDLDRFKNINDSLGHQFGDRVLKEVALRLKLCLRGVDNIARLGGDEFYVLLEGIEYNSQIIQVARKINLEIAKPIQVDGREIRVTTSIGIAAYPDDAMDENRLYGCSDVAMYQAKKKGGNTYQFFAREMNDEAKDRFYMENELRKALELDQLSLYYQPQIDMRSNKIIGVEALLRWDHPELGFVYPADFIPLAEESGLIIPIGRWVLETACLQNKAWQNLGLHPIPVAVNVSTLQFHQPRFAKSIERILADTGLDPEWLDLEITESIIMQSLSDTIKTLSSLKERGIKLSIDDFGTGYSSLSYLKTFPIDKLKIDKSFVHDIGTDKNDEAIVSSVISLARNMDMEVIAEGVENEEQLFYLIDKRCYLGQGFFFEKPGTAKEMTSLLKNNK